MSTIHYRKRVPVLLQPILNRKEFRLQFKSKDEAEVLNSLIENSMIIMRSKLDDKSKMDLVRNTMQKYVVHDPFQTTSVVSLAQAVENYLHWSKQNVSTAEFKTRSSFFTNLLPRLFDHLHIPKHDVSKITSTHLFNLSNKIAQLPNRRLYNYQTMDIVNYVNLIVKKEDCVSTETANKLIKRVRGLSNYGQSTGLYSFPNTIPTVKQDQYKMKSNLHRAELTKEEITTLFSKLPHKTKLLAMIVYYSGLRPSEIHKCSITNVDDIVCFDLRNPATALKTSSSYRIVPVHNDLLPFIDEISQLTYSTIRATSRRVKQHIDKHLQNTDKKSLYSLRHSFITHLINAKVSPEIVSELAGHTHNTMTMKQYFKGYDICILKQIIEML